MTTSKTDPGSDSVPDDGASEDSASLSRAEKKAIQRRNILDSAREVFFRDGFIEANLDEVAQRAHVAKGTLYRYFENKGELYVAVLAKDGQVFEERQIQTIPRRWLSISAARA